MLSYYRITSIEDPWFAKMHQLMQEVFPPEEVLEFGLWKEPLEDPGIHVYVAIHDDEVVGTTEYRYYEQFNVAMTDFTIIGKPGLGIGRFLYVQRQQDLNVMAQAKGKPLLGMFAEIYDPYRVSEHTFGGIKPMDPFVRREVLSHLGYQRLDFEYVHPSWENSGEAVSALDLCFMPLQEGLDSLPSELVHQFILNYYEVLTEKPPIWLQMMQILQNKSTIALLPL